MPRSFPKSIDNDVEKLIAGKIKISDKSLNEFIGWAIKEQKIRDWRKSAKKWAQKLKEAAQENDRPPGFDPDDDGSYPFIIGE